MKSYAIVTASIIYFLVAVAVFAMHTQMPVTFGLAALRSAFWPIWMAGGLKGEPNFNNEGDG
jgi:hypothetical protein